jgi:glycosyltransferase involved in cell wall biosynthesis
MEAIYSVGEAIGGTGFCIPAYHGAKAFSVKGFLKQLICTRVVWEVDAPKLTKIFAPRVLRLNNDLRNFYFDFLASLALEKADVFYGWSSHCLHQIRKTHALRVKTIVEKGSVAPELHEKLLKKAFGRVGLKPSYWSEVGKRRTLAEIFETDLIVVPSTLVRDSLVEIGVNGDKITVIPYGVDLDIFKPVEINEGRNLTMNSKNEFNVLSVGNLGVQKGTDVLLDAFASLKFPKRLLLAGSIMKELKRDSRLSGPGINLLGFIPNSGLPSIYSECDVFCLPSAQDGFGVVVLEAMACGKPVIVSENVGAKDLVEDGKNGFIVPYGDARKLAESISFLHDNPVEARRMGLEARKKALGFAWGDYEEEVVKAAESLL